MSVDPLAQAIHDTIHDYPRRKVARQRGAAALANRLGIRPGTLMNKANPEQEHQLTLSESIPVQLLADDYRILYAYSALLNHTPPIPFPDFSDTSNLGDRRVQLPPGALFSFFGDELKARFLSQGGHGHERATDADRL